MSAYTVSKPELMPGQNDIEFRAFIQNFLAFSARVAQCRAGFGSRIGLSGVAYTTLISIAHLEEDDGVGVSQLAEHLHLSGAFVTIEVNKLVTEGLVAKRRHERDRRRVLLSLTDEGRRRLAGLRPVLAPVNDALFGCLSAEEFRFLADLMGRLVPCGDDATALLEALADQSASEGPLAG
ncbi:DNA-binding transcriptional regulator, MarR family [Methylobacterium sp. 174MFSha1.1]|uniref:MarR family winged helix-turn-helix transcriptional regulator n=1 Tax=Methylobacterium sp. 174MFSha1.1 TaxID=1502749 RepID=UPI0008E93D33|nr:MarR family winged helix-turn-helix transcriptional regulator [Methylobacterium sp. 174MFSha1.1]SFV08900.1 DNA-binding transcriptional regulator, MarR family [Methylobacterium sp. 174MFSha1.1]